MSFYSVCVQTQVKSSTTKKYCFLSIFEHMCKQALTMERRRGGGEAKEEQNKPTERNEKTRETSEKRKLIQTEWNTNKPTNQPANERKKRWTERTQQAQSPPPPPHTSHTNCNKTFISGLFRITTCSKIKMNKETNQPIWIRFSIDFFTLIFLQRYIFDGFQFSNESQRFIQFHLWVFIKFPFFSIPFSTLPSFLDSFVNFYRELVLIVFVLMFVHNFRFFSFDIDIFRIRFWYFDDSDIWLENFSLHTQQTRLFNEHNREIVKKYTITHATYMHCI